MNYNVLFENKIVKLKYISYSHIRFKSKNTYIAKMVARKAAQCNTVTHTQPKYVKQSKYRYYVKDVIYIVNIMYTVGGSLS